MEHDMRGIQPDTLTDEELARISYVQGAKNLPEYWVQELISRLERILMRVDELEAEAANLRDELTRT